MTITYNDDPEIALGGQGGDEDDDDGAPSAPTAMAIAMPISATESASASVQQPSHATTVPLSTGDGTIEYSTNTSDGSLAVKSVTTTCQPNGYRNVETEYFHIPNHMADTVLMSLGAGNKPSSLYRTNMQQQILPPPTPPSSAQGTSPTPATAIAIPPSGTQGHVSNRPNNTVPSSNNDDQPTSTLTGNAGGGMEDVNNNAAKTVLGISFIVIAVIMISVGAESPSYSSPSYPSWTTPAPYPTYSYPSYPSPSPHSYPSTPSWNKDCPPWMSSDSPYAPIYNCKTTSTSPTITPNPTKSPTPTYSSVTYAPHPPFDYTDTIHKKKEPATTLAEVK